jgi:putative tricarboxylic transport membrane protein
MAWLAIKSAGRILRTPRRVLMPIVFLFCMIGAYTINNSFFDVGVMLAFGLLGYLMEENGFPIAPVILGLVLGRMIEDHFMSSMMKADSWVSFIDRPIAATLAVLTLTVWAGFIWRGLGTIRSYGLQHQRT